MNSSQPNSIDLSQVNDSTPILVGCGDVTDSTTPFSAGRSPFDLIAEAVKIAIDDTSAPVIKDMIDTLAIIRMFTDSSPRYATKLGTSSNPPKSIANRVGINPQNQLYTQVGGNTPQYLVNQFAEAISRNETQVAVIAGGEALRTQLGVERNKLDISWREDPGGAPEIVGDDRQGWSEYEKAQDARMAIIVYPLFENAIRGLRGHSISRHMESMAQLLSRFSDVASQNPLATRREPVSAERLAQVDKTNRWIGFPYPRLMNSNVFVDQASALIMTSVGMARKMGIPESRWVFLHGCADSNDQWYYSERENLHSSPAIRLGSSQALEMAGMSVDDLDFFDLYSCFPSAVSIACQELGLAEDDPRGLTVTGGLPFFGGPGNNYVTHSISEMMRRVRATPGKAGLVTANGYYLTKHSFGVYSTAPVLGQWKRNDPAKLQAKIDDLPKAPLVEQANGSAFIESYTIMHGRTGPDYSVIIGRETDSGDRFIANTPSDLETLLDLRDQESLGRHGQVIHSEGKNIFTPD